MPRGISDIWKNANPFFFNQRVNQGTKPQGKHKGTKRQHMRLVAKIKRALSFPRREPRAADTTEHLNKNAIPPKARNDDIVTRDTTLSFAALNSTTNKIVKAKEDDIATRDITLSFVALNTSNSVARDKDESEYRKFHDIADSNVSEAVSRDRSRSLTMSRGPRQSSTGARVRLPRLEISIDEQNIFLQGIG
jgi:hypothetical protein